jgi:energy-converting hydrogenase B subunit D
MTALQAIALVLVAAAGTGVVATPDPRRQVFALGFLGLALALLFFCFQAPDVALSQIVVGAVALPAMLVITLGRVREYEKARRELDRR